VERAFIDQVAEGHLELENVTPIDLLRVGELIEQYGSLPLGAVDASVIAVAERHGAQCIATLDRRHFTVVRPKHTECFTLLPDLI
jgi:hypothetical protein